MDSLGPVDEIVIASFTYYDRKYINRDMTSSNALHGFYLGLEIETRGDDTTLVEATDELNDNLLGAVIIDNLEVSDVACHVNKTELILTQYE